MARNVVRVNLKGPLFSAARRGAALAYMRRELPEKVAQSAYKKVMSTLRLRVKHPTPYYWTQVRIDRSYPMRYRVHDSRVIYGWWLEGIGSRNYPVTRFRGYHAFQLAYEQTSRRAPKIAQTVVARTVRRLGGTSRDVGSDE